METRLTAGGRGRSDVEEERGRREVVEVERGRNVVRISKDGKIVKYVGKGKGEAEEGGRRGQERGEGRTRGEGEMCTRRYHEAEEDLRPPRMERLKKNLYKKCSTTFIS